MGGWQSGRLRQTVNLLSHAVVRIHHLPPDMQSGTRRLGWSAVTRHQQVQPLSLCPNALLAQWQRQQAQTLSSEGSNPSRGTKCRISSNGRAAHL